jgi:uncharacterized membrane protein
LTAARDVVKPKAKHQLSSDRTGGRSCGAGSALSASGFDGAPCGEADGGGLSAGVGFTGSALVEAVDIAVSR